jgi:acyl-CoA thioesterase-1
MLRRWAIFASALLTASLAGCGSKPEQPAPPQSAAPATPAPADHRPVILAFGDSLTAGYGLPPGQSYPDFLQQLLDARSLRFRVVNQGISGDTTDGGASRLDSALLLKPRIVILELGANDGLRGLPIDKTRENLDLMITAFQGAGAQVLLCGMTLPRNYGAAYIRSFEKVFRDLAKQRHAVLLPFFLEGVATSPELMQPDGLHPTAEGCRRVAQNVFKSLEPMLVAASH